MTALLALLLLGELPGVALSDHGGAEKVVRHLNCTGAGVSCSYSSTFGTIDVTGSAITVPTCSGGQATTANGSSFSCVSNVSTATALAANPTDCSAGAYASSIDASGNLTCSQVSYSQLSGSPLAGGSNPQVQYNNAGVLGGMSNYTSDGTRPIVTAESSFSTAPSAGQSNTQDWAPATSFPGVPFRIDGTFGAIPAGVLSQFGTGASTNNWTYQCVRMAGYNDQPVGTGALALTANNWGSFGGSDGVWGTSLINRIPWVQGTGSGTANFVSSLVQHTKGPWRGNVAGAGGFVLWNRVALDHTVPHARYMFGLDATGAFVNEPSAVANSVYFGADNGAAGQTTMHICSNDNAGSATCADLGSNYPTTTNQAIYDMWLAAAPNASSIAYYIERLDVPNHTSGTISSDLPQNTVQLAFIDESNDADAGVVGGLGAVAFFNGMCLAYNY